MLKAKRDTFDKFVTAIEALGGRVLPMLVHDDPIQVEVPKGARLRAEELLAKFRDDLAPDTRPVLSLRVRTS